MSDGLAAYGTKLLVGDGGGTEVFAELAEVRNISGPNTSVDTTDVTPHSSSTPWRHHVATLIDGGEVTLDINFLPDAADQAALRTDMLARTKRNFRIEWPTLPTAHRAAFAAFVTGHSPGAPHDGELSASITLKITGAVTFAAVP